MFYTDNMQVYMTLKPCDKWDDSSSPIETCIEHIGIWQKSKMLKLNTDEIEFIVFSSKQHMKKTENIQIKAGSSYINYSMSGII